MKPSFFIIGAPRCGTTSMSTYLSHHRRICFANPKEPHYFSTVSAGSVLVEVKNNYIDRFFHHYRSDHQAVGEGSVSYLYSEQAIECITRFNPQAQFIVMIRNPIQMVPSYHFRQLWNLDEDVEDFRTAWELQDRRANGDAIPERCRDPRLLQYAEAGKFGRQIETLYQHADPDRCLVLLFDDFVKDPRESYRQVLDFINVEDDGRTRFAVKQASKSYRSSRLHSLMYRPPDKIVELALATERRKNGKKSLLRRARNSLVRRNTIEMRPAPLDSKMKITLKRAYAADIGKLSRLLGRDLSHWCN